MWFVAVAALFVTNGHAKKVEELPPSFVYIGNEADNSTMSMTCNGESPFTSVECKFEQIIVRSSRDKREEKSSQEVSAERDRALKQLKPGFQKQRAALCKALENEFPQRKERWKRAAPARRVALEQDESLVRRACNAKSAEELLDVFLNWEDMKAECTVFVNTFELTFQRVSASKWISNPGPQGLCDAINISTIERLGDGAWRFTQVRADANREVEFCRGLELNKPSVFSSEVPNELGHSCNRIRFGL